MAVLAVVVVAAGGEVDFKRRVSSIGSSGSLVALGIVRQHLKRSSSVFRVVNQSTGGCLFVMTLPFHVDGRYTLQNAKLVLMAVSVAPTSPYDANPYPRVS